jgi:hypothetical protein
VSVFGRQTLTHDRSFLAVKIDQSDQRTKYSF